MVANARKFNAALAHFDVEMRRIVATLEHLQQQNSGSAQLGVQEHRVTHRSEDERRIDAVKFITGDNYVCHLGVWKSVGEVLRKKPHRWPRESDELWLALRRLRGNYRFKRR